ncbi:MAG: hypothetical protein MZW92_26390 [Comamonadaceae bacterium]|nr:hypothetical protein [Comamonadaceae bacterium]
MTFRTPTAALVAAAALFAPLASAQSPQSAQARYEQERARCLSGQSHQAREVCLREAGAALEDARRGRLNGIEEAQWQANALLRCQRQPAAERELCERMARGEGTQTGSVEGGAIIRELRVTVPAEPVDATASPTAPQTTTPSTTGPQSPTMHAPAAPAAPPPQLPPPQR